MPVVKRLEQDMHYIIIAEAEADEDGKVAHLKGVVESSKTISMWNGSSLGLDTGVHRTELPNFLFSCVSPMKANNTVATCLQVEPTNAAM